VSSRLLVQRTIYDHFVEKLAVGVRKPVVGNGMDPSASKKQEERVLNYIQIGKGAGAEIATQGNLPSDPSMQEWILRSANNIQERHVDMKVAQTEIFGSVVIVTPFETKEKGVSITN
jgi:acyl-CoA reductase-like NAD-dependent aldehyde dehydrogenase